MGCGASTRVAPDPEVNVDAADWNAACDAWYLAAFDELIEASMSSTTYPLASKAGRPTCAA